MRLDFDPATLRVVSWDVDGTLYSMSRVKAHFALAAARALALGPDRAAAAAELGALRDLRRRMAAVRRDHDGVLGDAAYAPAARAALQELEERWYGDAISRAGQRDGLAEALDAFAARGVRQVVLSDYEAGFKLRRLGLEGRFDGAFAGEALGHLKPSHTLYRLVRDALGVEPAAWLHVGDLANRDGVAADAVGCRVAVLGREVRDLRALARWAAGAPANSRA